jgi:ABC-type transport system involved in multi-copper enzyme maturation permease subunit
MLWLPYRQHRAQILVTVGLLAALGILLLVNGIQAAGSVARDGYFDALRVYLSWLPVLPMAVGIFWGAPLLTAEYTHGTTRLAWTQSVSRTQWLTVKLGFLSLLVTAAGLAYGAMIQAWLDVFEGNVSADRFGDLAFFSMTGVAAGAWWLFGFLLGAAAGAVVKKALPAMAITIAVFVLVMIGLFNFRSGYATPVLIRPEATMGSMTPPSGMVVGTRMTPDRELIGFEVHPADRYWRFQWTEAAILGGGVLLLAAATTVAVRRRS